MGNKIKDPVRLGVFVLAAAALLLVALYLIGSKKNLFASTVSAEVTFPQVGGLRTGSNVRYMGINVGTVDRISILNDTAVVVGMQIRTKDARYIRTTAVATLGNDGLMGSRLVNLEPGEGSGTPLTEGAVLATRSTLDTDVMLKALGRTNQNREVSTDQVRILAIKLNTPGNAVDLLVDTLLAQDLAAAMAELRCSGPHARITVDMHFAARCTRRQGCRLTGRYRHRGTDPPRDQQFGRRQRFVASGHERAEALCRATECPGGIGTCTCGGHGQGR